MVETYEVNCSVKGKIYFRKLNKIVQLRYYEYDSSTFNYPTKEQWVRIANVPSELAPKQNLFLSNNGSDSNDFLCQIINNGYLNMYRKVDIFGWEIALNATWII